MGECLNKCNFIIQYNFINQPIGIMVRVFTNGLGDWG